jgi:autotransporter-associated beta strand protein
MTIDGIGANGTFTALGSDAGGAAAGQILVFGRADNASYTATAGTNGGDGGILFFSQGADGGTARCTVLGNATMKMGTTDGIGLSIGSLEGDGLVFLTTLGFGEKQLTVGTNNLDATFSGVIGNGIDQAAAAGTLLKTGSGTFTLGGANTYSGGTIVQQGKLLVTTQTGSATGMGAVQVNSGTLGGSGIISGAVTVGTASGGSAILAPAHGGNKQLTLTLQSSLTFNADAIYTYTFKAKKNKAKTDLVIANGLTINSGANLILSGQTQGTLKQGLVLTVISNTSANPIAGTFSNLPDGAIVTVNGNNLQASYTGGDDNDLTLTVVP